jgi:hypothetical protein
MRTLLLATAALVTIARIGMAHAGQMTYAPTTGGKGSVANLAGGGIPGIWTPVDRARRGKWIGATASRGGNSPPR